MQPRAIDKEKPYFEIQINGVTFDVAQKFKRIQAAFADCGFTQSTDKCRCQIYRVWMIKNGIKFPVPLTAMGSTVKC